MRQQREAEMKIEEYAARKELAGMQKELAAMDKLEEVKGASGPEEHHWLSRLHHERPKEDDIT